MNVTRCALLIPLIALVALSGCRTRGDTTGAVSDELRAENQRYAIETNRLRNENDSLRSQLQSARENKDKGPTVGQQLNHIQHIY